MTIKRQHKMSFLQKLYISAAVLLHPNTIWAQTAVYSSHQDTAEITLPLADTTDYTLENKGRDLYLSFSEPLASGLNDIVQKLPNIVTAAQIADDNKSILISVKEPVSVQNLRNQGKLTVKLSKQDKSLANQSLDNRIDNLQLNYGQHTEFARFTFDYAPSGKPEYKVKTGPHTTTVS